MRSSGSATCSGCRSSSSPSCSRPRPRAPSFRREYAATDDPETRKGILNQSLTHITTQLGLVRSRVKELTQLEGELVEKRRMVPRKAP